MAIVEARYPDGRLIELTEVNLTKSGLLIMITDAHGNQVLIHRFAWDHIVNSVQKLFDEEKKRAKKEIDEMLEKEKEGKNG